MSHLLDHDDLWSALHGNWQQAQRQFFQLWEERRKAFDYVATIQTFKVAFWVLSTGERIRFYVAPDQPDKTLIDGFVLKEDIPPALQSMNGANWPYATIFVEPEDVQYDQ
ncbi:MAG TPA: hypothetical protein VKQ72_23595 [Aggregatilineales bacterium]|nr:hypothetical protein [Aggregatilineales bacterium]